MADIQVVETKKWYKSSTNLFAVVILCVNCYQGLGAIITGLPQIPASILLLLNSIAGGGVMVGRNTATKPIEKALF